MKNGRKSEPTINTMNKFILGDCMDQEVGLPSLPDNHFDLCICDPPYGIDFQSAWRIESQRHKKIANDKEPFTPWLKALFPKMRDGGRLFIFYRWDVMETFLYQARAAGFTPIWDMVWDKVIHGMGDLKAAPGPRHEPFMYFTKGRYEFKGSRPVTVYKTARVNAEKMIHPNEKPTRLYEAIIHDFATPGENMIDPFVGSGASYEASIRRGMNFVGYEIDAEFYAAATRRIKKGVQTTLI